MTLDESIERHVFGRVPCAAWFFFEPGSPYRARDKDCPHDEGSCYWTERQPAYSTNMEAAMLVVTHLHERGWRVVLDLGGYAESAWACHLADTRTSGFFTGKAKEAPEAICRAAQAAMGHEIDGAREA